MDKQQLLLAAMLVALGVGHLFSARAARKIYKPSRYHSIGGKKLRWQTAYIDDQSHAFMLEFKVDTEQLGIACKMPKFDMVVPYSELHLTKTRALIGSLVQIKIPYSQMKLEISHNLAKRIDEFSNGKFGYKNI